MASIHEWLRELELESLAPVFEENEVGYRDLPLLSDDDLKGLGIALGPRRRLLAAIGRINWHDDVPDTSQDDAATPTSPVDAERRQLSVMFVDLVGSTQIAGRLDPEDMRDVIRAFQDATAGVISRYEGHIARFMGDGALAYFGWPRAHEDEAERAARAGLELARAIAGLEPKPGVTLQARIGIVTGLAVVGDLIGEGASREEMVVGNTPNLAARLQELARPGTVVISQTTARNVGAALEMRSLGLQTLKGFTEPVEAFELIGEAAAVSRFEARSGSAPLPMVGREHELALLQARWVQCKAGEGQAVVLLGEAGIGKSRISKALLDAVTKEPCTIVRYQCSPYHVDSALWPVVHQLEHAAGLVNDDSIDDKLDKLETLLAQAGDIDRDAPPLIADLLGLDYATRYHKVGMTPQALRSRTLGVLVEQMLGHAAERPVLVLVEDAHWIDPTTLEMIEQCIGQAATARVLIVLTARLDQPPTLSDHPNITRLTLNRLSRRAVQSIVARLGGGHLRDETLEAILLRTDGVPLFVEEVTKSILETGEDSIPASLHDTLMARLDRFHDVKKLAQTAAAIGREFSHDLLQKLMADATPSLDTLLDRLVSAEIVVRRGSLLDSHYSFRHALVRDAAYESLLKSKRQELHERIARVLQDEMPETVAMQPELIAHHCTEAGLIEQAIGHWHQAADQALQKSANLEAISHYQKALHLLEQCPTDEQHARLELDLQLGLGVALMAPRTPSAEEVRVAFARAERLCQAVDDTPRHFRALRGLWNWHLLRADFPESERLADQLRGLATRSGEPARRLMAHRIMGYTRMTLGDYHAARDEFRQGLELYVPNDQESYVLLYGEDPGLWCYGYLGWVEDWLGNRDQALRAGARGLELARTQPSRLARCIALGLFAHLHRWRGDAEQTLACGQEAIGISKEQGIAQWHAWSSVVGGWALAATGDCEAGLAEASRGYDAWCTLGLINVRWRLLTILADVHRMCGQPELALERVAQAEQLHGHSDIGQGIAELYLKKGDLLVELSRVSEGEAALNRALDIAARQQARIFQLRAATSLARMWQEHGDLGRAHDVLMPIYQGFSEGFDTAALRDAEVVISELV